MADIQDKVKELEKIEQDIVTKTAELDKVKADTTDYESKKEALEKEHVRVLDEIKVAREEKNKAQTKDKSFQEQFRNEQLEKAKQRIFSDFKYQDEDSKKKLLDTFTKLDDGSVDTELIYKNLTRAHLYLNPEKYIGLEQKVSKMVGSADDFLKDSSTFSFTGVGEGQIQEDVELTKTDMEAIQFTGMSMDTYKKLKKEGRV